MFNFTWWDVLLICAALAGPWVWGALALSLCISSVAGGRAARFTLLIFISQSLIVLGLWLWLGDREFDLMSSTMAFAIFVANAAVWWVSQRRIRRGDNFFPQSDAWLAWLMFSIALMLNGAGYSKQFKERQREHAIQVAVDALRVGNLSAWQHSWADMDDSMRDSALYSALSESLPETTWRRLVQSGFDPFYSPTVQSSPYAGKETGIGMAVAKLNLAAVTVFLADVKRAPAKDGRRNALLGENPLPDLLDHFDDRDTGARTRAMAEFLVGRYPELICARSTDIGDDASCNTQAGPLINHYVDEGRATAVRFLLRHGDTVSPALLSASHVLLGDNAAFLADIQAQRADMMMSINYGKFGEYVIRYGSDEMIEAVIAGRLLPWHAFDGSPPNVENKLLSSVMVREEVDPKMKGLTARILSAMVRQKAAISDWQLSQAFESLYRDGASNIAAILGPDISCGRLRMAMRAAHPIDSDPEFKKLAAVCP